MAREQEVGRDTLVSGLDEVIRLAPVPMVVSDRHGRLLATNRHWDELRGPGADGPYGWLDPLDPAGRQRLIDEVERTATTASASRVDLEMGGPAGPRWTRWWLQRRVVDGDVVVVMAVIDVHEDVSQKDDLRQLATRDDLTGLLNRRVFLETVEQALRRTARFPEPACVLYIDLDGFKSVNDRAGHGTGDRVLAAVAGRLRQAVRAADVVGRIGGDEFAVLIERLRSADEAGLVARRVEQALNGSVEVAGERWPMAASVGMALSGPENDSAEAILSRADRAMYLAKRSRAAADGQPRSYQPPHPVVERVDVHSLSVGMDQIRRSLETILRDLESGTL